MEGGDEVVRIAIRKKQIQIPVVVVVKKLQPPTAHGSRGFGNPHGNSQVIEGPVVIIAVNGKILAVEISYEEVLPTVVIEIRRVHAHPRTREAVGAVCHTGFGSSLSEFSFAVVYKQKIGGGIVGHKKIHPAIVIDIGGHNAPGFSKVR